MTRKASPPEPLESAVLAAVLTYLRYHPKVAFVWRANAGAFKLGKPGAERYIRAGFPGQSDIIGMLKDGRFLAVECKRPGGQLSTTQHSFLSKVSRHGGLAFMAQSIDDVIRELA